jgi:hypothetical protein
LACILAEMTTILTNLISLSSERRRVGPGVGPTSAFYCCIPTGMHGSTCTFWANLTPCSAQLLARRQDDQVSQVGQQCRDCGAVYAGRDWTYRGNRFTNCHFHNISTIWQDPDDTSVRRLSFDLTIFHLDDHLSSITATNNTFDLSMDSRVFLAWFVWGRDNSITGNTIISSHPYEKVADSALVYAPNTCQGLGTPTPGKLSPAVCTACFAKANPTQFLSRVPYATSTVWRKYPYLTELAADQPCMAKYNNVSDNQLVWSGAGSPPTGWCEMFASPNDSWTAYTRDRNRCARRKMDAEEHREQ